VLPKGHFVEGTQWLFRPIVQKCMLRIPAFNESSWLFSKKLASRQTSTVIEKLAYTLSTSLIAWSLHLLVVGTLLTLVITSVVRAECIRNTLVVFGLFPYFIFAFVLFSIFPFDTSIFGSRVYLPQIVCIVLICSLPSFYATVTALTHADPRIADLIRLSGEASLFPRMNILAPLCVLPGLAAARSAWPLTVLYTLLFEWARGDQSGLGALLQGIISTGDLASRFKIVGEIALISAVPYFVLGLVRNALMKRLSVDSLDLFPAQARESSQNGTPGQMKGVLSRASKLRCLAISIFLFCISWQLIFDLSQLDNSQKYPPLRFIETVMAALKGGRMGSPDIPVLLSRSFYNTIEVAIVAAALGTLAAALTSLAAFRSRTVDYVMGILVSLSQAVPIFVYIPLLLTLLGDRVVVATIILISMTFFLAYEKLANELRIASESWRELLLFSGDSTSVAMRIRKLFAVDVRILVSSMKVSLVLVFPYSITGAVIADLFLGLNGVGSLVSYQFRGDVVVTLLVSLLLLATATVFEWLARQFDVQSDIKVA
jgi:ABC-type nitrate/sulfonate/bicarbonate transport system permease component